MEEVKVGWEEAAEGPGRSDRQGGWRKPAAPWPRRARCHTRSALGRGAGGRLPAGMLGLGQGTPAGPRMPPGPPRGSPLF